MKTKSLLLVIPFLTMIACGTAKNQPKNKEVYTLEMQKIINAYPDMPGFEKRVIFLSKLKPEEEREMQIEIIPGRELYVDCNHHGLQGKMIKRTFEKNGSQFFLFNSNGEVFSTQMECSDDSKQMKFVAGKPVMTNYNSDFPIVVYTSQFFEVRYSLWKAGEINSIKVKNNGTLASEEAMGNSRFFINKEGFEKHVLYLPELDGAEEINRKVEIIPGIVTKVDCNRHWLAGEITTETLDGFGFEYLVFNSEGVNSTKKRCLNKTKRDEFVAGETKMLPYNSRLPIVIYTSKGVEVHYKIWETNGKMY